MSEETRCADAAARVWVTPPPNARLYEFNDSAASRHAALTEANRAAIRQRCDAVKQGSFTVEGEYDKEER